jgi:aspergillopepsin I
LDSPLFAVTLKYHAPGTYDFGYIDNSKYKGQLTYTDVDSSQGFWMFTADGYGVGNGTPNSNQISGIAGMFFSVPFEKEYQADPF